MNYKKKLTAEFKTKVALEAIKENVPLAEIAKKYEISPSMVSSIKEEFLSKAAQIFTPDKSSKEHLELENLKKREQKLLSKIGELQVENDFFASACEDAGLKVR